MKEIKMMIVILTLSLMHQSAVAQAACKGNKVLLHRGAPGCGCHCQKKCVSPADVQTYLDNGWQYGSCLGSCCWVKLNENSSSSKTSLTGSTTISFSLSQTRRVSLKIFDMNDQLVSTLADKIFEKGNNELTWNSSDVSKGAYFLQFQSDENLERVNFYVTK